MAKRLEDPQIDETLSSNLLNSSLYILGRHDMIACSGKDCKVRFEGNKLHEIVDGAGHSVTLSLAAGTFFELTFDWLEKQGLAP